LIVKPLYLFDSQKTYVIAGGLGGIGRSIARWMAERGARHLLFLSRSGTTRQEARALLEELNAQQVQALAPQCDITDLKQLRTVVEEACKQMPPIKGCIQGAMVLRVRPNPAFPQIIICFRAQMLINDRILFSKP